jgi:hypothetical protein
VGRGAACRVVLLRLAIRSKLPGWSQYAEPALCQAGFRRTCPGGYVDRPGCGHGYLSDSCGIGGWGRRVMLSDAALSMFGPMLEIAPRVLLVMACGLLAPATVRISARAIRQGCAGVFLAGWALGIVGVCGARIGFASLAFYGSPPMLQGVPEPMSGLEIWRFLWAYEAPIALAVCSGVLIALWLRRGREVGATRASSREARLRRIGAMGEARVAAELKRIGLPALHNVILCGGMVGRARSRRSCAVGDRGA